MTEQSHPQHHHYQRRTVLAITAVSVGACVAAPATPLLAQAEPHLERLIVATERGDHVFFVEIVDEPEEMMRGLMWRQHMDEDRGMLFLYDEPQPTSFWMRNTYISLDIIFIAPDGTVLSVAENTEPLSEASIPSGGLVVAVLEINAGLAARYGIGPGTRIKHRALSAP